MRVGSEVRKFRVFYVENVWDDLRDVLGQSGDFAIEYTGAETDSGCISSSGEFDAFVDEYGCWRGTQVCARLKT